MNALRFAKEMRHNDRMGFGDIVVELDGLDASKDVEVWVEGPATRSFPSQPAGSPTAAPAGDSHDCLQLLRVQEIAVASSLSRLRDT